MLQTLINEQNWLDNSPDQLLMNELSFSSTLSRKARDHFNLQQAVLQTLPENQDLLHVKTEVDWQNIITSFSRQLLSVNNGDNLVAHAIAILPNDEDPDADVLNMPLPSQNITKVTTLAGVITHPDHRGQGLMSSLINEWTRCAFHYDRPHMLGLITSTNPRSWSQFLKSGFYIVGAEYDPEDGSTAYMVHRDTNTSANSGSIPENSESGPILTPDMPLSEMKQIFNSGYVGYRGVKTADNLYNGNILTLLKPKGPSCM